MYFAKHPKKHDFTPGFGPKCNLMDKVEINGNISFFYPQLNIIKQQRCILEWFNPKRSDI